MNRKRDLIQIEEAYAAVAGNPPGKAAAKQQLKPGKAKDKTYAAASKGIKNIPVGNDASTQGFVQKNSGPAGADNFKSTELDPENSSISDENAFDVKQMSDEGADTYFKAENKKIAKENINNSMAKNKSIFDRLYEEVMDEDQFDAVELGIGDDDGGDDIEASEDQVTITIDKDLAEKLHEVLVDVLGGGEEGGDDEADMEPEGDLGDEDEQAGFEEMEEDEDEEADEDEMEDEDEENFNYFGEEIEAEDLGHPLVNQKKGNPEKPSGSNNKVKSSVTGSVGSKGGDGKVTDKVGDDGDEGHPLVNQKKGNPTSVKGSANVVKSKIKGGNQEFFQRNG